jgi:hypothetical protein
MNPIYLDLHIHTSENPELLNKNYDIDSLISGIKKVSNNSDYLISLTDHNVVNKSAYLKAKSKVKNLLIGAEIHIRNYDKAHPYHCHIFFNVREINTAVLDDINQKLDELYPQKIVSKNYKKIPTIEKIIRSFDSYDFMLLPHGGQSHSTFDKSIPDGVVFDNTLERSIYYNQFDGFTARSNDGLEKTHEYFQRLGIAEFINLITSTDNYNPIKYPSAKDPKADPFLPTWMFALPTFEGLRLSLSESSRLVYSNEKPIKWAEYIRKVILKNETIDVDVTLTPGLNVVIGGSSSGKTLFVDSVYNKIQNNFTNSNYLGFSVENINVHNPSGIIPHYISQNYIVKIVDKADSENKIEDIEILKNVFPGDDEIRDKIDSALKNLKSDLKDLINSIKTLEDQEKILNHIPILSSLLPAGEGQDNILNYFLPSSKETKEIELTLESLNNYNETLDDIDNYLTNNPFINYTSEPIKILKRKLQRAFEYSQFEQDIRKIIRSAKRQVDDDLKTENAEIQSKKQNFEKLLSSITKYSKAYLKFLAVISKISQYSIHFKSQEVESLGHKLYIENGFSLDKNIFIDVLNKFLKIRISSFNNLSPSSLYDSNFKKQTPKVHDYDDLERKIYKEFEDLNKKTYRIITKEGKNFDDLSAGWKTSVILDLILGYEDDSAPLIIDQPEDNLATNYINKGLIEAIKKIKSKKQIILVSHNATIPMLGDAQNVVLCKNIDKKIFIQSNPLEGFLDSKTVVDHIAEITDGGKSSIKKRVKKYNLKQFKN